MSPKTIPHSVARRIRRALRERANSAHAGPMQAYMKSEMPFLGVKTPELRAACRTVFDAYCLETLEEWRDAVLDLWRRASYREERYAAINLTGHRYYREHQRMKVLGMYEEMIVTGAWWDYVDSVATGRLGLLLRRYPRGMTARMRQWARSRDMWKRRSAILCQLSFKDDTDLDLLHGCIEPSIGREEFFLRKAIGWALREHAKTDPEEVIRYVRSHRDRLSRLSKREALRNVLGKAELEALL